MKTIRKISRTERQF